MTPLHWRPTAASRKQYSKLHPEVSRRLRLSHTRTTPPSCPSQAASRRFFARTRCRPRVLDHQQTHPLDPQQIPVRASEINEIGISRSCTRHIGCLRKVSPMLTHFTFQDSCIISLTVFWKEQCRRHHGYPRERHLVPIRLTNMP